MLKGVTIFYCDLPSETTDELTELVEKLGGQVLKDDGEATHLVTEECKNTSEAYKLAREKHLPVVLPRWIRDTWKAKMDEILFPAQCDIVLNLYKTPVFQNCEIAISGFNGDQKNSIVKLIESNGGKFTPAMSKFTCTHLICRRETGDKYGAALRWKTIKIVIHAWLEECVKKGYRLQEENFGLDTNDDGIEKDKIDETDDDETKAVKTKSEINAEEY